MADHIARLACGMRVANRLRIRPLMHDINMVRAKARLLAMHSTPTDNLLASFYTRDPANKQPIRRQFLFGILCICLHPRLVRCFNDRGRNTACFLISGHICLHRVRNDCSQAMGTEPRQFVGSNSFTGGFRQYVCQHRFKESRNSMCA